MSIPTALVEQARIDLWRLERLRAAQFPVDTAMTLAPRHDIDLHAAAELLARGCPPTTALDILS